MLRYSAGRASLSSSVAGQGITGRHPNTGGLLLLGVLGSVVLGAVAASSIGTALTLGVILLAVAVFGVSRRWGSAICLAPVFLVPVTTMPSLSDLGPLHPQLLLALASAALTTLYWLWGAGRPELNRWSLCAAAFLGLALALLDIRSGLNSLQAAISVFLYAYTGLVVGQCMRDPRAVRALAFLAVPVALLAISEALGLHSIWFTVFHADKIKGVSSAIRSSASFGHPLIAGACLVIAGLLLLSLRERASTVAAAVCFAGAATTVSRSALLGAAVGIAVFAIQRPGHRVRTIFATICLIAAAFLFINSIPELRESFDNRIFNVEQSQLTQQESVRSNSLKIVEKEVQANPGKLIVGGGAGYSTRLLTARGGNADGYDIFDNEYITMLYDGGLLVIVAVLGLLAIAAFKSAPDARYRALPALAAVVVIMYFVDGVEWPSLAVASWMTIGLFTAQRPPRQAARDDATPELAPGAG
jgi:O-Antigen ligase